MMNIKIKLNSCFFTLNNLEDTVGDDKGRRLHSILTQAASSDGKYGVEEKPFSKTNVARSEKLLLINQDLRLQSTVDCRVRFRF